MVLGLHGPWNDLVLPLRREYETWPYAQASSVRE